MAPTQPLRGAFEDRDIRPSAALTTVTTIADTAPEAGRFGVVDRLPGHRKTCRSWRPQPTPAAAKSPR